MMKNCWYEANGNIKDVDVVNVQVDDSDVDEGPVRHSMDVVSVK